MKRLMASLLCTPSFLLIGCSGHILSEPEQSLNKALFCEESYCPYFSEGTGSELKLLPGYRLGVNSVDLAISPKKDNQIFQLTKNDDAPNLNAPSISSFEFLIPAENSPVTRREALFVSFLLAAALDEDESEKNLGRDYSNMIEELKADPSDIDRLVRKYTTDMKIRFPMMQGKKDSFFDSFRDSYCSSKGKSGKFAPIDVQTLQFNWVDPQGNSILFHLGSGLDWSYSWTTGDVADHAVNTSVILTDDISNTMFGFDVRFDLKLINEVIPLTVSVCESLGEIARRVDRKPLLLIRDCRVAPKPVYYKEGGLTRAPCSEEGERLVIRLTPTYLTTESYLALDAEVADRLLLLPGDEVLFGE